MAIDEMLVYTTPAPPKDERAKQAPLSAEQQAVQASAVLRRLEIAFRAKEEFRPTRVASKAKAAEKSAS